MANLKYDRRFSSVVSGEEGRTVTDPLIDPTIRGVDWEGEHGPNKGLLLYTEEERSRRAGLVATAKVAEEAPDPEDVEIAETGQLLITDITPYLQPLTDVFDAAAPPPFPDPIPKSEQALNAEELAEILIANPDIPLTRGDIDAKKSSRT